jgi:hypothetical protein
MTLYHDNITIDASRDDCRIVIQLDENCEFWFDADCVAEVITKLSNHKRHPRVQELFEHIGRIVRCAP